MRPSSAAQRIAALRNVAERLEQRIQQARIDRARDKDRIARNIQLLAEGQRPFRNAVQRLAGAGQYAAPQMLAVLQDQQQKQMQPFVASALVTIGKPVVYPLSVALPKLDPVTQGQVARVLARIGYPMPLPYLKDALETEKDLNAETRQTLERAYEELLESNPSSRGLRRG